MLDAEADTRARIRTARAQQWLQACPSELQASNWSHPRLTPCRAQIDRVLAREWGKKGLLLSGQTGRGKSRSMWGLLKRLMCEEGRDVGIWRAVEWFAHLQAQVNYGRDDAQGFIRACARRPLLVMDDLGQEAIASSRQDWAKAWFLAMLDERLGEGRPMLITTNLSSAQMAAGQSDVRAEPLVRRLLELCEVVKF